MIDWDAVNMHEELNISLIEVGSDFTHKLKAELEEYEWALNRTKYVAEIKVTESQSSFFEIGDIIKLPLITHEQEGFLVWAPRPGKPNREFTMKALIQLN